MSERHDRARGTPDGASGAFDGARGALDGQVVIVTGAAGGIGAAVCAAVARAGGSTVVTDVSQQRCQSVVSQLDELSPPGGRGHLPLALDVRDENQNAAVVRAALERFGRIDALVACAGILRGRGQPPKPIVEIGPEEWDDVIDINLKGVYLSNRAVLPTMIAQRSGNIINVSSVQGLVGRAFDGPYCASKFGVIGLTQAVAEEVKSYGVKVQAIMPHAVDTPMWDQNGPVPKPSFALPPERIAELILFMLTQPADTVLSGVMIAPLGARKRKKAGGEAETPAAAKR